MDVHLEAVDAVQHRWRDRCGVRYGVGDDVEDLLRARPPWNASCAGTASVYLSGHFVATPTSAISQSATTPPTTLFSCGNASEDSFSAIMDVQRTSGKGWGEIFWFGSFGRWGLFLCPGGEGGPHEGPTYEECTWELLSNRKAVDINHVERFEFESSHGGGP